jgi:hypothetical protein
MIKTLGGRAISAGAARWNARYGGCGCGCERKSGGCGCGPECPGCNCYHAKEEVMFGGAATRNSMSATAHRPQPAVRRSYNSAMRLAGGTTAPPDLPADVSSMEAKMMAMWSDHGFLTIMVLMAKGSSLSEVETNGYMNRLLLNQDNIAYYFVPKFGQTAAESVSKLLREHIALAGDLIDALKSGDGSAEQKKAAWYDNAERIGAALFGLQGTGAPYLGKAQWVGEMKMHLDLLSTLVGAYLGKNFEQSMRAMDPYLKHIRHLSGAISKLVSGPMLGGPATTFWSFGPGYTTTSYRYRASPPVLYSYPYRAAERIPPYLPYPFSDNAPPYRYRTQTIYK